VSELLPGPEEYECRVCTRSVDKEVIVRRGWTKRFATWRILTAMTAALMSLVLSTIVFALSYLQTFDGLPAGPQPFRPLTDWDLTVHSNNLNPASWHTLEPVPAHHGSDCSAPPATHLVSAYDDTVFLCNNHVMTALNANGGYGVIYLTPNQLADFSAGEVSLRFDVSTLRTSPRDWIDLWVSPYADHLQLPLEDWLPDLNGPPRNAVHIRMDNISGGTRFRAFVVRNFVTQELAGNWWTGYESFLTPSATRRDTFELRLSRTGVKFGMPAYNFWWVDAPIADLGWDKGVVQLGHHSYNPTKDCPSGQVCGPNTWHWDNVQLSAAIPFTILRANQRFVDWLATAPVTLPTPAPQNARLRFTGVGNNIQVSFDGGTTWQSAQVQAQTRYEASQFMSYWTPIPTGVTSVQFRGQGGWWGGQWMVRDVSVWAISGSSSSITVTPTVTLPLVRTATPSPVATVTRTPTLAPTNTPTRQATATSTVGPTSVPTSAVPPSACSSRPPVGISTTGGSNRLRVTVTAGTSSTLLNNQLRSITFSTASNALIDVPGGPTGSTGDFTVSLPPGTTQFSFEVRRAQRGASSTVPFVVLDACGSWPTFVGGGANGF
jgi:hypothetical protein